MVRSCFAVLACLVLLGTPVRAATQDQAEKLAKEPPVSMPKGHVKAEDRSGRKIEGTASVYGHKFDGRKMANGRPYKPGSNAAASEILPLGTTAKVTNLHSGKTETVHVEDRGPHVPGRVVDLSPHTAAELGITHHEGVAPVVVAPVAVPQKDGGTKPGAGAADHPADASNH
jgi:rare lipoprotein A